MVSGAAPQAVVDLEVGLVQGERLKSWLGLFFGGGVVGQTRQLQKRLLCRGFGRRGRSPGLLFCRSQPRRLLRVALGLRRQPGGLLFLV